MQVFLTGVSGYLGRVLAEDLARVPEIESITGIDVRVPQTRLPSKVKFVQMDMRSPDLVEAMAGHEVIVHTAFVVLWRARMSKAERDDINLNSMRNVAQAAVANNVQRFVHTSSVAAYDHGLTRGKQGIDEDFPVGKGDSFFYYANGKALAERTLHEVLGSSRIGLTFFRPYYIIGPRNMVTVEGLRKSAIRYAGHDPHLQYVHEDDVASAFVQAVTTEMAGAYNVVPDDWLRWSNVLEIIGQESALTVPVWVARSIAALTWCFLGSPLHPTWVDAMLADFTVSNAKLKATGWRPRYSCEATLRAALHGDDDQ